jgi:hypothetical protein
MFYIKKRKLNEGIVYRVSRFSLSTNKDELFYQFVLNDIRKILSIEAIVLLENMEIGSEIQVVFNPLFRTYKKDENNKREWLAMSCLLEERSY